MDYDHDEYLNDAMDAELFDEEDLYDDFDDDEIDEDDALNYIEDLDDESDPFEEEDEVDDNEPLDKLYDELSRNPFRRAILDDEEMN